MPELPEVEHVVRYLAPRLRGRRIGRLAWLDWPRGVRGATPEGLAAGLRDARIEGVERRGKIIVVRLDGGRALCVHLKMTGKLWVVRKPPDRHTRAIFELSGPRDLRFEDQRKFGWIALVDPAGLRALTAALGPDGLAVTAAELGRGLRGRRPVKAALLDQRLVAGVGNIYADEALFEARVHPARPAGRLTRAETTRLAAAVRDVLARAVDRRSGTPDQERVGAGRRGVARRLGPLVYQRTGEPCERCRTPIARAVVAGRATHYCPRCQRPRAPGPGAPRAD